MSGVIVLILRILLAALLYGFLGWALFTIWRDLRAQGQLLSTPNIPEISFSPLNPSFGEPRAFATPEIIIGRSSKTDYPLSDETVSARHARLSYHHNQWWVEDLGSTNGSFINDERVSVPTVIVSGDELRFGQVGVVVGIQEKAARPSI